LDDHAGFVHGGDKLIKHTVKSLGKLFGGFEAGGLFHREQGGPAVDLANQTVGGFH
jgi:hypothetical protein